MIVRWAKATGLVWGLCLLTAAAHGQRPDPASDPEASSPEDPEAAREAREHFSKGMAHFEAHAYREAIREFQLAAQRVPSADLWFNIARAHEELSEYEPAVKHYRLYLRDRVDPPDAERVEAHIARLERALEKQRAAARRRPTTGTLRISGEQEGAAIEVDGRSVGEVPMAVPLSLPPGTHRLEVQKRRYVPFRSEVTMEAGVTTGAYVDLQPATEYRSIRGRRIWTWVVGGLAVGALGTSAGLGVRALRLNKDGDLDGSRDQAAYADYALGAALGLGVVAAILYFIEGRSTGTERVQVAAP